MVEIISMVCKLRMMTSVAIKKLSAPFVSRFFLYLFLLGGEDERGRILLVNEEPKDNEPPNE